MKYVYAIEGMHCQACVNKIKLVLSDHFMVDEITFNPAILKIEANQAPSLKELNARIVLAGKYNVRPISETETSSAIANPKIGLPAYFPIFLIAAYIIGVASLNNFLHYKMHWQGWMNQVMAGFFLVFSAFKFLDIRGFKDGYASYDLLAIRWPAYGYLYPFLELSLGVLYLTAWLPVATSIATIIIMGFSSIGVINSLLKKQKFQCACLGSLLKVPLSSITLIEDLTMVFMAALALIMR